MASGVNDCYVGESVCGRGCWPMPQTLSSSSSSAHKELEREREAETDRDTEMQTERERERGREREREREDACPVLSEAAGADAPDAQQLVLVSSQKC